MLRLGAWSMPRRDAGIKPSQLGKMRWKISGVWMLSMALLQKTSKTAEYNHEGGERSLRKKIVFDRG